VTNLYFLFIGLAFVAAVTFVLGLYVVWNAHWGPEARRTTQRLRELAAGDDGTGGSLTRRRRLSDVPAVDKALLSVPHIHVLDRLLTQSGTTLTVGAFLGIALAAGLVAFMVPSMLGMPAWIGAIAAAVAVGAWYGWIEHNRRKRMRTMDRQLPDMLDFLARAMQAGHAFTSALQLGATEGPQPIAGELQTTFNELNFGMPATEALQNLAARVPSADLRFFVVSALIQQEAGGNLAEILTSIAILIRERQNLAAHVHVLSAEGRLSAWVLFILPFALGFLMWILNPAFIALLWTDPAGVRVLAGVIAMMAIGAWWMRSMVNFRT
jgi:tight adherence protein B